jgi:hypothetical protein
MADTSTETGRQKIMEQYFQKLQSYIQPNSLQKGGKIKSFSEKLK